MKDVSQIEKLLRDKCERLYRAAISDGFPRELKEFKAFTGLWDDEAKKILMFYEVNEKIEKNKERIIESMILKESGLLVNKVNELTRFLEASNKDFTWLN